MGSVKVVLDMGREKLRVDTNGDWAFILHEIHIHLFSTLKAMCHFS